MQGAQQTLLRASHIAQSKDLQQHGDDHVRLQESSSLANFCDVGEGLTLFLGKPKRREGIREYLLGCSCAGAEHSACTRLLCHIGSCLPAKNMGRCLQM